MALFVEEARSLDAAGHVGIAVEVADLCRRNKFGQAAGLIETLSKSDWEAAQVALVFLLGKVNAREDAGIILELISSKIAWADKA